MFWRWIKIFLPNVLFFCLLVWVTRKIKQNSGKNFLKFFFADIWENSSQISCFLSRKPDWFICQLRYKNLISLRERQQNGIFRWSEDCFPRLKETIAPWSIEISLSLATKNKIFLRASSWKNWKSTCFSVELRHCMKKKIGKPSNILNKKIYFISFNIFKVYLILTASVLCSVWLSEEPCNIYCNCFMLWAPLWKKFLIHIIQYKMKTYLNELLCVATISC